MADLDLMIEVLNGAGARYHPNNDQKVNVNVNLCGHTENLTKFYNL